MKKVFIASLVAVFSLVMIAPALATENATSTASTTLREKLDNVVKRVENKIKFIKSNLLNYFLKSKSYKLKAKSFLILANLPYLSKKIYNATMSDVKKFEPRSALLSGKDGLDHYHKLLAQIKHLTEKCCLLHVACFMEISPEQKNTLHRLIKKFFPRAEIKFYRDLAGKWRFCEVEI